MMSSSFLDVKRGWLVDDNPGVKSLASGEAGSEERGHELAAMVILSLAMEQAEPCYVFLTVPVPPHRKARTLLEAVLFLVAYCLLPASAKAQGNYEIQVYGADTVAPASTMIELHSNYTVSGTTAVPGSRFAADGTEPTSNAVHETVEITQGINDWFETGFYIFTSAHSGFGWEWVGDHIRPRVRIPDKWHWPVGVSLSNEIGYQRARFSPDTWTLEVRPIVDKQLGPWYLSFNPTFDRSFHGPSVSKGFDFSPNFKFSYDVVKQVSLGLEYYAAYGNLTGFDPFRDQQQDFFPSIDLNVSPQWEFNFGVGIGATRSTDHLIVKWIIGRRFSFRSPHKKSQQP